MKNKLAKTIRVLTIAPVVALALLIILYVCKPMVFGNTINLVLAIVFIVALPISAYPLQKLIPHFKESGRDGQRTLAIITANIGYILGIIAVFITGVKMELFIIYLTYLFSGALVLFINKVVKIRASGHACGVLGPIAVLIYFLGFPALFGLIIILATYWSSLQLNRHTTSEFLMGSLIPIVALFLAFLCTKLL